MSVTKVEGTPGALCTLHARGREAWPDVDLDFATFCAIVGGRVHELPFDAIRAEDLCLAVACAAGVARAIATLDQYYISGLRQILVRRGMDAATAADVMQTVRIRFLVGVDGRAPRIADYNGHGSLSGWIGVSALRTAISLHRKDRRETVTHDEDIAAAMQGPELDLLQRRFGAEFSAAFRSAFKALRLETATCCATR